MKTIIIPTDFSPISINAINYGVGMAKEIGANIILFYTYNIPMSITEVPVQMAGIEEMRKSAENKLQSLKENLEHISSGTVKIKIEIRLGNTVDELQDYCKGINPIAIIMGTRGTSDIDTVFFGSTSLKAIRHLSWPVIVVPPGKTYQDIKKIGFACDFKQVLETTPVNKIKDIIKGFDSKLYVLNIDHNDKNFSPDTPHESILLHEMLDDLNPSYHFINHPDIAEGVRKFAEENNLDMIIVIPKKHTLFESLFHKSNSKQLITHTHIPVMCMHEE